MKNKDTNKTQEEVIDFPRIIFDPQTTVKLEDPKLNSYGLDITDANFLKYQSGNLQAEVIGGVNVVVLTRFQVMVKIARRPQMTSQDVYRNNVDLYNENNLQHFIKQASIKLKVDTTTVADFVYDLMERLETYRKDKRTYSEEIPIVTSTTKEQKEVDKLLKSDTLLEEIQELLTSSGIACPTIGLQLFLIALSSKQMSVMHGILQGNNELSSEIIKSFSEVLPIEINRFKTSISDNVLYYAPSENYWKNKVLLLPTIDTLGKKNTAITELILQGQVNRLVTENTEQGSYKASNKSVNGNLSFISATSKGFHELMQSDTVMQIPICNTNAIKESIVTNQIKRFAGLLDENKTQQSKNILQGLFRVIKNIKIINPYLEQIDVSTFFSNDSKLITQYLKMVNVVTLLHQKQLELQIKNTVHQMEVEPRFMLMALELFKMIWFKQEKELSFNVACTLVKIKRALQKQSPDSFQETEFILKEMRAKLKVSPSSFARHISTLYDYNKLERTSGNNKEGFSYKVITWEDNNSAEQYEAFKKEILSL
jgi:hypothetical protein